MTEQEELRLKIRVASIQHAVDWGTGIVSREQREHSFRLGDENGYQRAIDDLKEAKLQDGFESMQHLESRQKLLTNSGGQLP